MPRVRKILVAVLLVVAASSADGQVIRHGTPVAGELRNAYEKGLGYLVKTQRKNGSWGHGTGVTAICLMALIASGEDPNFGRYAEPVRRSIRYIIGKQDERTGYIQAGMYDHGFAMLALADCYGAVDDSMLWPDKEGRPIAKALELAVRCAVTSQEKNPFGGWRYSPSARDADTSVSGAILMGLLGARNAGLEVPDLSIDRALEYYASMTTKAGLVGYAGSAGLGGSQNRSAIATLVFSVAKRKDLATYAAARGFIIDNCEFTGGAWPCYFRYYMAQALFQADYDTWRLWNKENTRLLIELQAPDGSIKVSGAGSGLAYSTGMVLLSAAVNWCFLPVYER